MALKPWLVATLVVVALGAGALIGQWYIPRKPTVQIEFKENSCAIHCPAQTAYPSLQGSIGCQAGSAPRCQCTQPQEPIAGCVPVP